MGLGLVEVSKTFEDGSLALQLRTKNCGFTTVTDPKSGEERLLEVRPKLEETDWLRLLRLAVEQDGSPDEFFELDHRAKTTSDGHPAMLEVITAMYRHALDGFFARGKGLRRLHRSRDETLRGKRRGKVRIRDYMSNVANGRPLEVPCRHPSHELDNLPNRTLLTALRILLQATGRADERALDGLGELPSLRKFRPRFGGVGGEPVEAAELTELRRLPESFRHYRSLERGDSERTGPLPLARWIIENFEFERESGAIRMPGMAFTMWEVFEKAFAQRVEEEFDGEADVRAQETWQYELDSAPSHGRRVRGSQTESVDKSFQPDLLVDWEGERRPLVIDTKWKAAISDDETVEIGDRDVSLKNGDVNQISAYARLAAARTDGDSKPVAALVYPFSRDAPESARHPLRRRVRWERLDDTSNDEGPDIYVLFWNVSAEGRGDARSRMAASGGEAFSGVFEQLEACVERTFGEED